LTRLLMTPSDQIAWFAVLRAPWCGLLLRDMDALVESNPELIKKEMTVWQLVNDENRWHAVSADARARLSRLRAALQPCVNHRLRQSLRKTVEAVWLALGGVVANSKKGEEEKGNSVQDAQIFLDYLERHEQTGTLYDQLRFEQGLSKLYAKPDLAADDTLQIMTIHKAKGLEFDTVIIPGLGRAPRNNKKQLLKWMEQPTQTFPDNGGARMDLLLAPIQEVGSASDSIYQWIEKLDQDKALFEADRLLYVAATRAKKFLHLLGHTSSSSDSDGRMIPSQPMAQSLLSRLWPSVAPRYHAAAQCHSFENDREDGNHVAQSRNDHCGYRLPTEWTLPDAPSSIVWQRPHDHERIQDEIEFSWASEMARHVGNVVHRWLQRIAEDELQNWTAQRIQAMRDQFKHNLLVDGMIGADHELENALDRVIAALTNAISDERGRWILSAQQYAQNELKITAAIDHIPTSWIIDRTFLDSMGVRWIIDYKIGSHEGSDIEQFLDREKIRYQYQLDRYAHIMQQLDSRVVKRGLYFPLIRGWREW
ncbi:MAG: PD-(D/E)XK nuclease family protein, partial [Nitrosomonas sp.]|nr:PD-(D/E)XK nuclease family protein [Nitrosomonas sp.]